MAVFIIATAMIILLVVSAVSLGVTSIAIRLVGGNKCEFLATLARTDVTFYSIALMMTAYTLLDMQTFQPQTKGCLIIVGVFVLLGLLYTIRDRGCRQCQ